MTRIIKFILSLIYIASTCCIISRGENMNFKPSAIKSPVVNNILKRIYTTSTNPFTFVGPLMHTNENGELIIIDRAAVTVKDGKIISVVENATEYVNNDNVTVLKDSQFLIPGFIDCHVHAVQFPNLGIGYDKPLLEWLESYTFPLEKEFKDEKFAEHVFNAVVKRTLSMGTTTACYFASLYKNASIILAQKAAEFGQRAFIGKVNMNEERKDKYYESTEESIKNTKQFITEINAIRSPLIKPIITPRFALSCDMKLMKELGKIAKEHQLPIQTHISENIDEINEVKRRFALSYAGVYDEAGLLTNKTILAHGVHLTDNELELLKKRETAIIHCPLSNTSLRSGLCNVSKLKRRGLKVGLGTDVAGGESCSMLDTMRGALQVSGHLSLLEKEQEYLNYIDVFHMATLGGAKALGIDHEVGNFLPGKQFDALVVDINTDPLDNLKTYTLKEKLQRFIYSGDERNIIEAYVNGCKVK